jgi:hypothetical protein
MFVSAVVPSSSLRVKPVEVSHRIIAFLCSWWFGIRLVRCFASSCRQLFPIPKRRVNIREVYLLLRPRIVAFSVFGVVRNITSTAGMLTELMQFKAFRCGFISIYQMVSLLLYCCYGASAGNGSRTGCSHFQMNKESCAGLLKKKWQPCLVLTLIPLVSAP